MSESSTINSSDSPDVPDASGPNPRSPVQQSSLGPSVYQVMDLTRDERQIAYDQALHFQRGIQEKVIERASEPLLIFLQHAPVITISRRKSAPGHLLATESALDQLKVAVHETDRGGDITYHGPGQLVVYPIIPIVRMGMTVGGYMRFLEQWVIDTLVELGIQGERQEGMTGVWVRESTIGEASKIAALGVRVRKGVAMHGAAINVSTKLDHFDLIVPCGLSNRNVCSLASLGHHFSMADVIHVMLRVWQRHIKGELLRISSDLYDSGINEAAGEF